MKTFEKIDDKPVVLFDVDDLDNFIKVNMTIREKDWIRFKEFCYKNGMKASTRVNKLIRDDIHAIIQ
jgi:hypothetical protein